MTDLIPLAYIPSAAARAQERTARRALGGRTQALEAAQYRVDVAPGCHSKPNFDPPCVGWTVTRAAAAAVVARLTHMPDGTSHRRTTCGQI